MESLHVAMGLYESGGVALDSLKQGFEGNNATYHTELQELDNKTKTSQPKKAPRQLEQQLPEAKHHAGE